MENLRSAKLPPPPFHFKLANPPRTMTREEWKAAHRWLRQVTHIIYERIKDANRTR